MTERRSEAPVVLRHWEAFQRSRMSRCSACEGIFARELIAYLDEFVPQDPMIRSMIPGENTASYTVCEECARMPEKIVFMKVQEYLIKNGLFEKGHKPLDRPGGHSPDHRKRFSVD